jgi:hypothetical protein
MVGAQHWRRRVVSLQECSALERIVRTMCMVFSNYWCIPTGLFLDSASLCRGTTVLVGRVFVRVLVAVVYTW